MTALSLLGRVPVWAWVIAAVVAWGGWQRVQLASAQRALDKVVAEANAQAAQAAASAAAESQRRVNEQEAVIRDQQQKLARARADAAAAAAATGKLRERLAAIGAERADDSTAAAVSSAARTSASVLADLLGRCSDRRLELAGHADAARAAGVACERSYDALTEKKP